MRALVSRTTRWVGRLCGAASMLLGSRAALAQPPPAHLPGPPPAHPPGAQPPPANLPGAPSPPSVPPEWFVGDYQKARSSVVRIECGGAHGAGFFFHSPRHIATAYHVIELGRGVTVTLSDGRSFDAEVVATDVKHDLAILEIHEGASNAPLPPATDKPDFGTPILIIGHPLATRSMVGERKGLLEWNPGRGIVTRLGDEWLQIDVLVNGGDSGGPVLDREGRVLGVISHRMSGSGVGLNFAVPVKRLEELAPKINRQGSFHGGWAFNGSLALVLHVKSKEVWAGPELGIGVTLHDRWTAGARLGLLWPAEEPQPRSPIISRSRFRLVGELDLGHRFLLFPGGTWMSYLRFAGGVAISSEEVHETSATIQGSRLRLTQVDTDTPKGRPLIGVTLLKGPTSLGYAFLFDVDKVSSSLHRISIGGHF
jgi:S1-C subfamily serine protease